MNVDLAPFDLSLDLAVLQALPGADRSVRRLGDMRGLYDDQDAVVAMLAEHDPIIYEFGWLESKTLDRSLSFGLTRVHAGTVGREYYMTRGHFHLKAGDEIYLTLSGEGLLLLQTRDGRRQEVPLAVGKLAYVPTGWGHRTVNVGETDLVFLSVWPARIDHDYDTVARTGFPRLVVKGDNGPEVIASPTHPGR